MESKLALFFKMGAIACLYARENDYVKREKLIQEKEELIVETKSFSRWGRGEESSA